MFFPNSLNSVIEFYFDLISSTHSFRPLKWWEQEAFDTLNEAYCRIKEDRNASMEGLFVMKAVRVVHALYRFKLRDLPIVIESRRPGDPIDVISSRLPADRRNGDKRDKRLAAVSN